MIVRILMLFVLWAGPLAAAWGQENQCGENAALDGVGYVISPSGGDDTETIQCALDSESVAFVPRR